MPDNRLVRNPAVVCTDIDDGAVLLDLESTAYYSLNRTGLRIWNFLEEARTLDGIATHLVAEFEVDRDQALTSAERFVSVLEQEGLIRVVPA